MESRSKNSIAILVPMLNEQKVAKKCVDEIMKVLKQLKNRSSLVVIDDGSIDKTPSILKSKAREYKNKLIVITHSQNKGYGAALQTGMIEAEKMGFEWVLHMDSDLTNDPNYILEFNKRLSDKVDCIKASRYIKGSHVLNVPLFRRVISIGGNLIASLLFDVGIRDCTNGFRVVRLKKLKNVNFREKNFSIILEELYYLKQKHARFEEMPYTLTARTNSRSHFRYKPKIFYDYFKYVIKSALLSF